MSNDYQGAEEALVDEWVRQKLVAAAATFNAISSGLGSRIYNRLAPASTPPVPFPYIIFQCQSPPSVVRGVGDAEVMVDTIYIVKAVAQISTYDPIVNVASGIRSALVEPNGSSITGGSVFTCRYERGFSLVETEAGKQFRHLGGEFRIQAQAS